MGWKWMNFCNISETVIRHIICGIDHQRDPRKFCVIDVI